MSMWLLCSGWPPLLLPSKGGSFFTDERRSPGLPILGGVRSRGEAERRLGEGERRRGEGERRLGEGDRRLPRPRGEGERRRDERERERDPDRGDLERDRLCERRRL